MYWAKTIKQMSSPSDEQSVHSKKQENNNKRYCPSADSPTKDFGVGPSLHFDGVRGIPPIHVIIVYPLISIYSWMSQIWDLVYKKQRYRLCCLQ